MERKTTRVKSDLAEWIEQTAAEYDQSESWVLRQCAASVRSGSIRIGPARDDPDRDASDRGGTDRDGTDRRDPDRIDGVVSELDWPTWGGQYRHREIVRTCAWALRDEGSLETSELRAIVRAEMDPDMTDGSLDKQIRVVKQLPWVEHGGGGGHVYRWIGSAEEN